MEDKKKNKKGLLSAIQESMDKTGGCCGPGETCGGSKKEDERKTDKDDKEPDKTKKK